MLVMFIECVLVYCHVSFTNIQDGLRRPSNVVDAFVISSQRPAVTLTFDLWPPGSNQVTSRG